MLINHLQITIKSRWFAPQNIVGLWIYGFPNTPTAGWAGRRPLGYNHSNKPYKVALTLVTMVLNQLLSDDANLQVVPGHQQAAVARYSCTCDWLPSWLAPFRNTWPRRSRTWGDILAIYSRSTMDTMDLRIHRLYIDIYKIRGSIFIMCVWS